jgi:hypothetical protein
LVLNPKNRMNQRIILLCSARLSPYSNQSFQRTQFWFREMSVIVPDWRSVQSWKISNRCGCNQQESEEPIPMLGLGADRLSRRRVVAHSRKSIFRAHPTKRLKKSRNRKAQLLVRLRCLTQSTCPVYCQDSPFYLCCRNIPSPATPRS